MIKLIASDIDGTIVGMDNAVCEDNLKAMKDISNNNNVNFAIFTGKTYPIIKKECAQFNAQYGIFGNGNQIINLKTGEEIYKKILEQKDINYCIQIAKNNNLHIHVYTEDEIITEELRYMDLRNYKIKQETNNELVIKIVKDIERYIQIENKKQVLKLVISSQTNIAYLVDQIERDANVKVYRIPKYGRYKDKVINKEYEYLDIVPKNTNKSEALKILQNYLKIQNNEVMAIGDNVNDIDMIKNSGIGVAVGNAYDEIKQVAKYTTQTDVEHGAFAEAIYKYIEF